LALSKNEPRGSLRETTYAQLKDLILTGQLRPSERLSENTLAKRFGVSRTPLREALMKLEEEGLVVGQRNLGYTVSDLDITAFCNLLVVREALDVCAARLACAKATEEDLDRLRDVIVQMVEVLWEDLEHTDLDEHRAISDAICARDPEAAEAAARAHVQSSLKNMSKLQRIWAHRRAAD
jgi:DNA-binding GntR family transcriptional regulator